MTVSFNVSKLFSLNHLYAVISFPFSQTPLQRLIISAQFSELFSRMENYQKQAGTDKRVRLITNINLSESYLEMKTKRTRWN